MVQKAEGKISQLDNVLSKEFSGALRLVLFSALKYNHYANSFIPSTIRPLNTLSIKLNWDS